MRTLFALLLALALASCSTQGVPTGTLAVVVDGLPSEAGAPEVELLGPVHKTVQAPSTTPLPAGQYVVKPKAVLYQGILYLPTPTSTTVEIKRGQPAKVAFRYQVDTSNRPGYLAVAIGGLPSGADADVRVIGVDTTRTLTQSTVLELAPGTYIVEAHEVVVSGSTYVPDPTVATVVVSAGESASQTILYSAR